MLCSRIGERKQIVSGKNRENKKCNKKYNIWRDFKGIPDCCAFFNAYSHDISHGRPVSRFKFSVYICFTGSKSCRAGCWISDDL